MFKFIQPVLSIYSLLCWGRNEKLPDIVFVEKDSWISSEEVGLSNWRQNGHSYRLPKLILLATNITAAESNKAKAAGFADTVFMKPLRASMVAACLQQVLGIGQKNQHGRDVSNQSTGKCGLLYGKKMLVVDDNVVNRRVAAGALKKFGADVQCAESGQEALKWLQIPHDFSACFMDIQMPEMDGYVFETLLELFRNLGMVRKIIGKNLFELGAYVEFYFYYHYAV